MKTKVTTSDQSKIKKDALTVGNNCAYILQRNFKIKKSVLIKSQWNSEQTTVHSKSNSSLKIAIYDEIPNKYSTQKLLEATVACDYVTNYLHIEHDIPKFEIKLIFGTNSTVGIELNNQDLICLEKFTSLKDIKNRVNQLDKKRDKKERYLQLPTIPVDLLTKFCKDNQIIRLALFGSILTKDFNQESDVDLLAEFQSGKKPSLLKLAGMEIEASRILKRKVDLRLPTELSSIFRNKVIEKALLIYDKN